jgi:sterol desaturase/sphingolipid hydroxylase (fatty acid hydroxylase superfamily)
MRYFDLFIEAALGYSKWFWGQITFQSSEGLWSNYFYLLILISGLFFALEMLMPWREKQARFRKDFCLDFFYMFFNFFLFSVIIFAGISEVGVTLFKDLLTFFGISNLVAINIESWTSWAQLLTLFIVKDFVEWWIHRLLHRSSWLWEFHKVHHSVEQMGFAAHLRYHWMENVVYKTIEYVPLAMIGFSLGDFFLVHMIAIAIGHWNHANFHFNIGWLKYIFNNSAMHIWHHAKDIPEQRKYGINFGLSLSVWDYIFGTDYIPHSGRDIELGFADIEKFPDTFIEQNLHGFVKDKN